MNARLANKNKEVRPEQFKKLYGKLVSKLFRRKYSQDDAEAIVNNYLDDPTNEAYVAEMKTMQEYRKACKAEAKLKLGI